MKTLHALRLTSLVGLGSLLAASGYAQDSGYYYGGLSIGQSRAKIDEERITASLLAAGLTTTAMARDEKDTAYKLFGGYQFNRHFALEGGYFNLGDFSFTSTTAPAGTLSGKIRLQGLNLDLVGTLPLTERLSAIGRVGAQYARARDTFSGTGAVSVLNPDPSKSASNYKLGVGLQYEVNRSFLVRGEAERYRINDAVGNRGDVNVVSLSLVFPFGRSSAPAPRVAAAQPVYVAPAAAPAPVVAAAPVVAPVAVVPERRRVSFSADSLFTFDQSTIRPEGKTALDTFAKDLHGTRFEVITVEGHTDRLGSQVYNQTLSSQRAEAVKSYLVHSGGIDAAKVSAVGMSESTPVTQPADCKGSKANPTLIACLQPDRRVEVEVAGTR
ncbi:OmpA family protein [Piscinibacter sp.]|uniref:OmpA family protein n=1 Tax=Piscinibacter sp. TaxID=1903157 RepID=UPI002B66C843|nr:OmpA family protein [Albitalea sp.]HUG24765.1 OmpA family protein [Albitalea sp.]